MRPVSGKNTLWNRLRRLGFKTRPAGYTILEVMIFLAVSLALLISAMKMVSGKQEETQFNQKMRDVKSKIDSWYNDVANGFPGGTVGSQYCKIVSGRPQILPPPLPAGYSPDCIFLGKAIQFPSNPTISQADTLYAYSIFGNSTNGGALPTSIAETSPAPAVNQAGVDLTEPFSLEPAYIQSVTGTTPSGVVSHDRMISFYSSFNTEKSTIENGATDINFYSLSLHSTDDQTPANAGDNTVRKCLETGIVGGTCNSPNLLQSYAVCFTDGHHLAKLLISSTNGTGVSTNLSYPSSCP